MRHISPAQLLQRIRTENPWWSTGSIGADLEELGTRAYFNLFFPLVSDTRVRRAVVLMGPRRVGKTVLIHHTIAALLERGVAPEQIAYVSVDHPLYNDLALEDLVSLYRTAASPDPSKTAYVFFDEVQYLKDWEIHLKTLVDGERSLRLIASGSAAAALSLKSRESGAGRFTDFLLPPLTFYEYMDLLGETGLVREMEIGGRSRFISEDIALLNDHFLKYLNFGGYPEAVFSPAIQADPARFIKSDIIDKVLLRDLPSLYGISDIQELNKLFTTLAFNSANEVSLRELASNSGVATNTLKRYMEYLEAAFLIKVVHRIDDSAKRFQRVHQFKVYLTNPSMRAALFAPVEADSAELGGLAETAIFAQYFHDEGTQLHYSRWKKGEVDIVKLDAAQRAVWAVEVKWSDRFAKSPGELKALLSFCKKNALSAGWATTRTVTAATTIDGIGLVFIPTSEYCYTVGHNIVHDKGDGGAMWP